MASSGNTKSTKWSEAYWQFEWTAIKASPGVTTVNWTLSTKRDSSTSKTYYTKCRLFINGEKVYELWDETAKFTQNGVVQKTGSFNIQHGTDGSGSFTARVYVTKIYDAITAKDTVTFDLDENFAYTACTIPNNIKPNTSIQAPGGTINFKFEGQTSGVNNPIQYYVFSYQIGDSAWSNEIKVNQDSVSITLPSNASRGKKINARVSIIDKSGIFTYNWYEKTNVASVNSLPAAPGVESSKNILPSTGGEIKFEITKGKDSDSSQTTQIAYATSPSGTKTRMDKSITTLTKNINKTTTYYFWTYDGLEYSSAYTPKEIIVNTKPTVSLEISEDYIVGGKVVFTKGENGQSDKNTYTFGFTYNNEDVTLSLNQIETTYIIEDIRKQMSDKLIDLRDDFTYYYKFWVYRNDGIENSDKVYTGEQLFSIPKFTLKNDNGAEAPFSNKVEATLSGDQTGDYTKIGFNSIGGKGLVLNTSELPYGTLIDKLLINDSFYITLSAPLRKVLKIDITPSNGKTSPFDLAVFKTYTTQSLEVNLVGRTDRNYGLTAIPALILKRAEEGDIVISPDGSSNTDKYIYFISGSDIYSVIDKESSESPTVQLTFEIKNEFGDSFTEKFNLLVDNTEPAIPYGNIKLYPGFTNDKEPKKYPNLDQWEYLKEGMPIYTDFSVLAFDEPTFYFEIYNYQNSGIWKTITSFSGKKDDDFSPIESYGETHFNASPFHYYINEKELKNIEETIQDHNVKFRMRIQTTGQEKNYDFFKGRSVPVKAHYSPRAHFTKANFTDPNLETEWIVEDYGYSSNGVINQIGLYIQETGITRTMDYPTEEKKGTWENFTDFKTDTQTYECLNIALVLYSTISVNTINTAKEEYTNVFTTAKETKTNLIYSVVYNISPTVSYRKNHLGINTNNFQEKADAILVIGETSGRNRIYYSGPEGSYCKVVNFLIDCGSW